MSKKYLVKYGRYTATFETSYDAKLFGNALEKDLRKGVKITYEEVTKC